MRQGPRKPLLARRLGICSTCAVDYERSRPAVVDSLHDGPLCLAHAKGDLSVSAGLAGECARCHETIGVTFEEWEDGEAYCAECAEIEQAAERQHNDRYRRSR